MFDALPQADNLSELALPAVDTNGTRVYNFAVARVGYARAPSANRLADGGSASRAR
jgi:hypothetical protein